jgi:hypothetical protein
MKSLLLITLTAFSLASMAEENWHVVARTLDCSEHLEVKAKDGVPYVMIGSEKIPSKDDKPFSLSNPDANFFENENYAFRMPGMVENGVPKLEVKSGQKSQRCNMKAFRK